MAGIVLQIELSVLAIVGPNHSRRNPVGTAHCNENIAEIFCRTFAFLKRLLGANDIAAFDLDRFGDVFVKLANLFPGYVDAFNQFLNLLLDLAITRFDQGTGTQC